MFDSTLSKRILLDGLLVVLVLVPYWRLTTMQGCVITDDVFASDLMNNGFPERCSAGRTLRRGELPLWMPEVYGGFPLLARAEAGALWPVNLVLYGLLSPLTALNLSILFTMLVAIFGTHRLCRQLGIGQLGAIIAALGFGYSGFFVSHMKHLSMVNTACWLPVGLWLIERGVQRRDWRCWLGLPVVVALQDLAGHIQISYYSSLVYGAYYLWRSATLRPKPMTEFSSQWRQSWLCQSVWFVGLMLLGHGIGAVQILPTYELVGLSGRAGGASFEYASQYSYDLRNAGMFLWPGIQGLVSDATYTGRGIFWEDYGYIGLIPLAFAGLGIVQTLRRRGHWFFVLTLIVAYLLVLGPNTPVFRMAYEFVPGMKFFRFPTRWLVVVDLTLCVLAAYGLHALWQRMQASRRLPPSGAVVCAGLLIALTAVDLFIHQLPQNPIVDADQWMQVPANAQDLLQRGSDDRIYSPFATETHKATFRKAKGWEGDLTPYVEQREFLQPSSQAIWGLAAADGYMQLTPNDVVDIWGDQHRPGLIHQSFELRPDGFHPKPWFRTLLDLANVRYLLCPWPLNDSHFVDLGRAHRVFRYENPTVLARARVVGTYEIVTPHEAVLQRLQDPDFSPAETVLLDEAPDVEPEADHAQSFVRIESAGSLRVNLEVQLASPGIVVLADTHYPGWEVAVDGEPAALLRAYSTQRAVAVPAGDHRVEFRFRSKPFRAGVATAGVAVLVYLALLVGLWRKKSGRRAREGQKAGT